MLTVRRPVSSGFVLPGTHVGDYGASAHQGSRLRWYRNH